MVNVGSESSVTQGANTRDRLIDAALDLFARRGFRGTRVGDIEAAAGLAPRCGGLYKHFASKRQLLEAALERQVQSIEALRSAVADMLPLGELRADLTLLARWVMHQMKRESGLLRILQREADLFPELIRAYYDRLVRTGYRETAEWSSRLAKEANLSDIDTDALGAVMIGAILNYRYEEAIFGEPPAGLGEERFLRAWVDICMGFIHATVRDAVGNDNAAG